MSQTGLVDPRRHIVRCDQRRWPWSNSRQWREFQSRRQGRHVRHPVDQVAPGLIELLKKQPGFVRGQLLIPLDGLNKRVIIGTWDTRAAWEAWHGDATFVETRKRLEGLEAQPGDQWWHEVILDVQP